MTNKSITINKGLNLQYPHKIVGLSELGNIDHVDIEEGDFVP